MALRVTRLRTELTVDPGLGFIPPTTVGRFFDEPAAGFVKYWVRVASDSTVVKCGVISLVLAGGALLRGTGGGGMSSWDLLGGSDDSSMLLKSDRVEAADDGRETSSCVGSCCGLGGESRGGESSTGDVGTSISMSISLGLRKMDCAFWTNELSVFGSRAVNGVGGRGVRGDMGIEWWPVCLLAVRGVAKLTA